MTILSLIHASEWNLAYGNKIGKIHASFDEVLVYFTCFEKCSHLKQSRYFINHLEWFKNRKNTFKSRKFF